jgi:pterin-4a-carbinolamine dehydratase
MCPCKQGNQSADHILFDFILHEQDRDKLKAVLKRPDSWLVSKDKLGIKYHKNFKEFKDNILLNKE